MGSLFLTTGDTSFLSSTIIDGDSTDCTIAIYGNIDSTCRITGFTIQNGIGCVYGQGAGIYVESASPRLDNLIIKNNISGTNGGGICLNGNSNSLIDKVLIKNNSADVEEVSTALTLIQLLQILLYKTIMQIMEPVFF